MQAALIEAGNSCEADLIFRHKSDVQVDVWALGITAIEMAESQPPKWTINPMRVIFMITREPPPQLSDLNRWSLPFHDFVAQSLQKARAF